MRFPRTENALRDFPDALAHIEELERTYVERRPLRNDQQLGAAGDPARPDFDVAIAGGGLSLLYGAILARRGLKVVIFDRRKIGCGHREWNISRAELEPLARSGLFLPNEVDALVEQEYARGIVRWHGGGTYPVRHVLDCVVDAETLLTKLRTLAESANATLLDHHPLNSYRIGKSAIEVRAGERTFTARLLIDAMGAASPHAAFDLSCPTVGGVLKGLREGDDPLAVDSSVGEILVTTEDVEEGRQHIWEGFPRPGGFTAYLFYYCEPDQLGPRPLMSLYERFFTTRARYKEGDARLIKPTYGFIPAYSRLRPMTASPCDRVVLVGDAAGRHSPLTFCGFGSMIRSFLPVSEALHDRLKKNTLARRSLASVWSEPAGLGVMGGLTLMMLNRAGDDSNEINRLLDVAFSTLSEMGEDSFAAFIRDEIGFTEFITFMRRTAARHGDIYQQVFRNLGAGELASWSARLTKLAFKKWRRAP